VDSRVQLGRWWKTGPDRGRHPLPVQNGHRRQPESSSSSHCASWAW
jgi:hypothetical protein